MSRELVRRGHACIVAARAGDALAGRADSEGLRVVGISPGSEIGLATALRLRRVIERERIDVVHAQASHALGLSALATLGTRARLVVTRHLARAPRANVGTRWKYGRADAVIAVSNAAADSLRRAKVVRESIDVIPGGVERAEDRQATPASPELLQSLGVRPNAPLVVSVGALVPQKDPITFVHALSVVRRSRADVQSLWVGAGELRGEVERERAALGLDGMLHLAGFRTDVDALMSAASVFVLSSTFEGLPLVVMDAFTLGVPVVATDGSGIPEIVRDGESGLLVPVGNAEALGEAIVRVLSEPQLADALRRGGSARAPEYSIERTVERTITVYERVLGGGRRDR